MFFDFSQNFDSGLAALTRTAKAVDFHELTFLGTKPAVLASERIYMTLDYHRQFQRLDHTVTDHANPAIWWAHSLCWQAIKSCLCSPIYESDQELTIFLAHYRSEEVP